MSQEEQNAISINDQRADATLLTAPLKKHASWVKLILHEMDEWNYQINCDAEPFGSGVRTSIRVKAGA